MNNRTSRARVGLLITAILVMAIALVAQAAGTVVVTSAQMPGGMTVRYTVDWTSSGAGAVSGNAFSVQGRVLQVEFTPDSGLTAPDNLYDVTLLNQNSVDILNGSGANLSNTAGLIVQFNPPLVVDGSAPTLDVVVANAGAAKGGLVTIWVQR